MNGKIVHGPYLVNHIYSRVLPRQIDVLVHVEGNDVLE